MEPKLNRNDVKGFLRYLYRLERIADSECYNVKFTKSAEKVHGILMRFSES